MYKDTLNLKKTMVVKKLATPHFFKTKKFDLVSEKSQLIL